MFNVLDGSLVYNLTGHNSSINDFDFDNTDLLASASYDGKIKLWNVKTGLLVKTMSDYTSFYSIAFDNKGLVFGGTGSAISVFDASKGIKIHDLKGHMNFVEFLRFDPTGLLVSGADDKTIRIWNTTNNTEIRKINIIIDSRFGLTHYFSSSCAIDNTGLVAYSFYSSDTSGNKINKVFVHIYNYLTGALISEFVTLHTNFVRTLRFDNKGVLISYSNELKFWKISK